MLRLLIDENFNHRILRGLKLRVSSLDYILVQETTLLGCEDAAVLAWAADQDRIVLTHDLHTMPQFARQRLFGKQPVAGLIAVPDRLPIGLAIEDLVLLVECCDHADLRDQILYLPF